MQERRVKTESQINTDLLSAMLDNRLWFWIALGGLGLVILAGAAAAGYMFDRGLGVTGLNRPVFWGFFITNFVFWVGISHAGVMLSAILRLAQAEWRRPATRAAEVLTIFSLATALLFPLLHTGRPWRVFYWVGLPILPYDLSRGIFQNVRSALLWDPSAIFTYLTSSTLFVYIALVPDLAVARDRTTGWRRALYGGLALGFRGNARQWRLQAIAGILLSALILPVFVSVHSIVSWDFAAAVAVEGWHQTIFAPYFVIGAVHSGVSGVVTVMILMAWLFKWGDYIRPEHFDALGRLLIVVATAWFYFFFIEFSFGLFSQEAPEVALRQTQVFGQPWGWMYLTFIMASYFIPVPLWLFRKVRRSLVLMFWTTILVNIGMWLERFLIIVPSLMRKQGLSFVWGDYNPSPVEVLLVAASFAVVLGGVLVFSKLFPLIPIYDAKEGLYVEAEIQVGRRTVPAVVREE